MMSNNMKWHNLIHNMNCINLFWKMFRNFTATHVNIFTVILGGSYNSLNTYPGAY